MRIHLARVIAVQACLLAAVPARSQTTPVPAKNLVVAYWYPSGSAGTPKWEGRWLLYQNGATTVLPPYAPITVPAGLTLVVDTVQATYYGTAGRASGFAIGPVSTPASAASSAGLAFQAFSAWVSIPSNGFPGQVDSHDVLYQLGQGVAFPAGTRVEASLFVDLGDPFKYNHFSSIRLYGHYQ